jgi:hypothetical protein
MTRMISFFAVVSTVVVVSVASANAQSITVVGGYDVNAPGFTATGTYALLPGQTIDYVRLDWYKESGQNLIWVSTQTVAAANGSYPVNPAPNNLPTKDANNMTIMYTVIAKLYIKGNNNPVAYSLVQHLSH